MSEEEISNCEQYSNRYKTCIAQALFQGDCIAKNSLDYIKNCISNNDGDTDKCITDCIYKSSLDCVEDSLTCSKNIIDTSQYKTCQISCLEAKDSCYEACTDLAETENCRSSCDIEFSNCQATKCCPSLYYNIAKDRAIIDCALDQQTCYNNCDDATCSESCDATMEACAITSNCNKNKCLYGEKTGCLSSTEVNCDNCSTIVMTSCTNTCSTKLSDCIADCNNQYADTSSSEWKSCKETCDSSHETCIGVSCCRDYMTQIDSLPNAVNETSKNDNACIKYYECSQQCVDQCEKTGETADYDTCMDTCFTDTADSCSKSCDTECSSCVETDIKCHVSCLSKKATCIEGCCSGASDSQPNAVNETSKNDNPCTNLSKCQEECTANSDTNCMDTCFTDTAYSKRVEACKESCKKSEKACKKLKYSDKNQCNTNLTICEANCCPPPSDTESLCNKLADCQFECYDRSSDTNCMDTCFTDTAYSKKVSDCQNRCSNDYSTCLGTCGSNSTCINECLSVETNCNGDCCPPPSDSQPNAANETLNDV